MKQEYIKSCFNIGEECGYPVCCIHSFHTGNVAGLLSERERKRLNIIGFNNYGYIPCKKCLEQSRRSLIKRINKKRNKLLPSFPFKGKILPLLINQTELITIHVL